MVQLQRENKVENSMFFLGWGVGEMSHPPPTSLILNFN